MVVKVNYLLMLSILIAQNVVETLCGVKPVNNGNAKTPSVATHLSHKKEAKTLTTRECSSLYGKHKWVWTHRWYFKCENCGKFGTMEDGYIVEED